MIGPRPCLMVLAAGTAMLVLPPSCETNSRALVTSPPSAAAQKSPTTTTGAGPDEEIGGGVDRPVVDGALLTPGAHYRAAGELQDIDVVLRGPSSPLYSIAASHYLGLSADRAAFDTIVSVLPIGGVRTFRSPDIERSQLDDHTVGAITDESRPTSSPGWPAARS